MQTKTKNRLTIVLTILFFTAPVVVAYVLSSGLISFQPEHKKNNGHFVSPLVKLADYTDKDWVKALDGNWTLIRRVPGTCAEQCIELEDELHRYRLSLGHRAEKLNLLLIADAFSADRQDPYVHVKKVSTQDNAAIQAVFDQLSDVSLKQGEGLYVVAPEGFLMMAFTPENTSTQIIRDLSLLVKRKGE